jgi:tellurite resistance protein
MTDEERQRAMDFIVEQQAKNSVEIDRLNELFSKAEHRFDRHERILKMMIRAGRRERRTRSEADDRLTNALAELAEAQKRTEASIAHTDGKLDALVDIVRRGQNGRS